MAQTGSRATSPPSSDVKCALGNGLRVQRRGESEGPACGSVALGKRTRVAFV